MVKGCRGQYAVDAYLNEKKVAHPESAGWGTPQMIPRINSGKVVACQYWDGTARLNENKEKSPTVGKWLYGLVPGDVAIILSNSLCLGLSATILYFKIRYG